MAKKSKRSKKKTPVYRSKFEQEVADRLEALKVDAVYEPFKLNYTLDLVYTPDWVLPNGVILEAKGKLDYETRRKMEAVKKANPKLDIRFIFMRASNKLNKASKMTYGAWADKHGFPWCDREVPKEWVK